MHDFSGVTWYGLATLAALFFDQPKDRRKFRHRDESANTCPVILGALPGVVSFRAARN